MSALVDQYGREIVTEAADPGKQSVTPKRPSSGAWVRTGSHGFDAGTGPVAAEVYDHPSGTRVLSSVDFIPEPEGHGLEFHVSISCAGRRASREQVRAALRDFGMKRAEEDNHVPGGIARNFWLPVDPKDPVGCECVNTEKPHDEGDGFIWREVPKR